MYGIFAMINKKNNIGQIGERHDFYGSHFGIAEKVLLVTDFCSGVGTYGMVFTRL